MILLDNNRFGYYSVEKNKLFHSKNLAFSYSLATGKKVQFIYNDDIFSKYDWTKEPEPNISLKEFYIRRAQQLRNEYDYIILQFSGGPDSKNILDTFLLNDIKLDEIVNFNTYKSTGIIQDTIHNADYIYNVKPIVEKNIYPKIRIIDEIDMTKKIWEEYKSKDYFELLFSSGTFASFWMMKGIWIKYVPDLFDKIISGKKVCILLGVDKTNLKIDNNKYYTNFNDIMSCDISTILQNDDILNKSINIEFFYHTPKFPELIIKQAHILKNTVKKFELLNDIESFEPVNKFDNTDFRNSFICLSKKFSNKNLKYNLYHSTIYPTFYQNLVTPKHRVYGTKLVDCWWVDNLDEKYKQIWIKGMRKYILSFYPLVKNTTCYQYFNGKKYIDFSPLPLLFSKKYYLE